MAISAGLAAKAAAVMGTAGLGVTAIYFGGDYLNNSLSKYDQVLINLLESKDDYDFKFEVKKGENGTTDFSESDLKIESTPNKLSVLAKVQVSSGTNSLFKKGTAVATDSDKEFADVKNLNNKQDWTWECNLEFKKVSDESNQDIEDSYKKRILSGTDKGLLGILKKDLSNYTKSDSDSFTKEQLKQVKIDFIKNCAYWRGFKTNKKINSEGYQYQANDLKVNVPAFDFMKQTGSSNNKLIPKYTSIFDYWFKEGLDK